MYISPVDILGISVSELMNLDAQGVIRLEKMLKMQQLRNKQVAYNPQQYDALLEQLMDEDKKSSILFVEEHPNLKKFITTGKDEGVHTFTIDEDLLAKAPHVKEFLAPYFEAYFMRLVKEDYQANKYDTILGAMKHKSLFTDGLLTEYYEYIKAQIDIVVERIVVARKGKLLVRCPQIAYKTFVELMNTVPLGFIKKTKLAYVNAMVDYYNATLDNYKEFPKIIRAFKNFRKLEVGDKNLMEYLLRLSNQIGDSWTGGEPTKGHTSSSGWRVVAIIIGIIVFIGRFSKVFDGRSNSSYSGNPKFEYPSVMTAYDEDKTAFYSDLIHKATGDTIENFQSTNILSGRNPYPLQFKNLSTPYTPNPRAIPIKNKRSNPLIIFLEKNDSPEENESVSLAAGDSLTVSALTKNSKLILYSGAEFVTVQNRKLSLSRDNRYLLKPAKRYFKSVSGKEGEWLKNKYVIDSLGSAPYIELRDDLLLFHDIGYHIEPHEILPPEPLEETKDVPDFFSETLEIKEGWKAPKSKFFKALSNDGNANKTIYELENGENPYPDTFKNIDHIDITGYEVLVSNNSHEDLILFSRNLSLIRDQAAFIAQQGRVKIRLHDQNDTLYFYKGRKFYKNKAPNGTTNEKTIMPDGRFGEMDPNGKKMLQRAFAIRGLGADPAIQVTDSEIIFDQIDYKN